MYMLKWVGKVNVVIVFCLDYDLRCGDFVYLWLY